MSEWIRLKAAVFTHPKTRRLARRCGIPAAAAGGHMACLWCWALEFAPDGDLSRFDEEEIAIGAGWEGEPNDFTAAAAAAGYLDIGPDGDLHIHDWMEHGGKLVAMKVKDRERAAERRASARLGTTDARRASTGRPTDVRPTSAGRPVADNTDNTDSTYQTEDLSSDESAEGECTDVTIVNDDEHTFEEFWSAYPRKEGRKPARTAWGHVLKRERPLAIGVAEVMSQLVEAGYQERRFVPHASTFLHQHRWDDWRDGIPAGWQHPGNDRQAAQDAVIATAVAAANAEETS